MTKFEVFLFKTRVKIAFLEYNFFELFLIVPFLAATGITWWTFLGLFILAIPSNRMREFADKQ